jgi:hypothetical protein
MEGSATEIPLNDSGLAYCSRQNDGLRAMLITLGWFTEHGRVAERVPHIWERDGLRFLTELSDSTTAELTWMLDRTKVRTTLARLGRGTLDAKRMPLANRLLTTFAVLAEAERDFGRLNAELNGVVTQY